MRPVLLTKTKSPPIFLSTPISEDVSCRPPQKVSHIIGIFLLCWTGIDNPDFFQSSGLKENCLIQRCSLKCHQQLPSETKWDDAQIQWTENEGMPVPDHLVEEVESYMDPFADPDPLEIFTFKIPSRVEENNDGF
jgi:hypothetical protein